MAAVDKKGKGNDGVIGNPSQSYRATERHLPYGITPC